jgi:hypothetical protein
MKERIQIVVCFCFVIVHHGSSAISRSEKEFLPFGQLPGHQQNPDVAIGPQGGFAVWQNSTLTSKGERVVIHRLNVILEGEGRPMRLTADTGRTDEKHPRVALMPEGGAVVSWESGSRRDRDIHVRFVNSSGQNLTGVTGVNGYKRGNQTKPDVAVNSRGDVLVTWESEGQDGDGKGIYAQRYTPLGIRVGGEIAINQSIKWNQSTPAVIALNDDRFLIGWMGETDEGITTVGTPIMRSHVMGRIYDRQGNAIGNEFRLDDGQALCSQPRLVAEDNGGFVVAWSQQDEDIMSNLLDVYLRNFNEDGLPKGVSKRQNNYTKGIQRNIGMAKAGNEVLMVWDCEAKDGSSSEVHGRLVSGGAEFRVNTKVIYQQRMVAASGNVNGRAIVLWVDVVNQKNTTLKGQRFSVNVGGVDLAKGKSVTQGGIGPNRMPLALKVDEKAVTPGGQLEQKRESQKQEAIVRHESVVQEASQVARAAAAKTAENTLVQEAVRMSTRRLEGGSTERPSITRPPVIQTRQSNGSINNGAARLSMRPAAAKASRAYGLNRDRTSNVARSAVRPTASSSTGNTGVSRAANVTLRQSARNYSGTRQSISMRRSLTSRAVVPSASAAKSRVRFSMAKQSVNNRAPMTSANRDPAQQVMKEYASRRMMSSTKSRFTMRSRTMTAPSGTKSGTIRRSGALTATQRVEAMRGAARLNANQVNVMRRVPVPAILEQAGNRMNLRFNSQVGRRYVVQTSSDKTNWENSGGIQRGTGNPIAVPVRATGGQRFIRVVPTN